MTAWSGIGYYECLTRQDIEDNIQNGTFTRLSTFTVDNKLVTKAEVSAYISFTPNASFNAKTSNQIIIKGDINAGSITPPPTPTPTPASFPNRYYVRKLNADCTLTSTYLYANLGAGITPPTVNQYVTLSTNAGCWQVVSIDQSNSVTDTINAVYPTSCTCTSPLLTTTGTLTSFTTCLGVPSAYQTLTISGVYLTDNITIISLPQLEFSLQPTTNYVSSLTLTPSSGTVSPTTIYVRLSGLPQSIPTSLTISITSLGASPIYTYTGTSYTVDAPAILSVYPSSRQGAGSVYLTVAVSSNATADWYTTPTGGTVVNTGTSYYPYISATTTYYVQARDTSGNNCTPASSTRTAIIATITVPPTPAPLVGTLGTSNVFWGSLAQYSVGTYIWTENGYYPANEPNKGNFPTSVASDASYWAFNGAGMTLDWSRNGGVLTNRPSNDFTYTLMFYGQLSDDGVSRILWSRGKDVNDGNSAWAIIWQSANSRFLFRTLNTSYYGPGAVNGYDQRYYISYPWTDVGFKLYTFTMSSLNVGGTVGYQPKVELYVNETKIGEVNATNGTGDNEVYNLPMNYRGVGDVKFSDGNNFISSISTYYNRNISNMLMYNTTLTQSQISSIYQYLSGNIPTSTSTNIGGSTNSIGTGTFYTLY